MVALHHPRLTFRERLLILRDTGLPAAPLKLLSAVMAGAAVLVWADAGLVAVAALLGLLAITIPLARAVGDALRSGDDLLALKDVSDQRAAEVARLASDRERLTSELFQAEQRERAQLAESLHDVPMQRLAAIRQDTAEREGANRGVPSLVTSSRRSRRPARSSRRFIPATVRELGFKASLGAAIAPSPLPGRSC